MHIYLVNYLCCVVSRIMEGSYRQDYIGDEYDVLEREIKLEMGTN